MEFSVNEYVQALPELDLSLRMPAAEFAARAAGLRQECQERGLDAAVAYGTEYRPGDTGWLTNIPSSWWDRLRCSSWAAPTPCGTPRK